MAEIVRTERGMPNIGRKFFVFLEMIKFEHSIFALPFAYMGLLLGERGMPRPVLLIWVTVAMVSFRTMAMALNRLIDRPIDAENPRTENRALPAGKLTSGFVWLATLLSFVIFEVSAYRLNPLCFQLSPIPVFLAWLYPWTKRFTWLSHGVLGIILGIAPYGAWLASRGTFSWIPGLLTIGVTAWVAGFDIIYALQDQQFDRQKGLFSFPARFGQSSSLVITRCLHTIAVLCWVISGVLAGLGFIYMAGVTLAAIFLIYENWLVRTFGLAKLQEAFFTMNAVVSIMLFLAMLIDFSF